jgi:hypothetical protein
MLTKLVMNNVARAHRKAVSKIDPGPHLAGTVIPAPWVVEIAFDAEKHGARDQMDAAGVLVSERHVLTSAHTFAAGRNPALEDKQYFVRCGSEKLGLGARCEIERVIVHPDFKVLANGQRRPNSKNCDLAVIVLSDPASVEPIAVMEGAPLKSYSQVSVLGWPLGVQGTGNLHQVNTAVLPYACGLTGGLVAGEFVVANFVGAGQLEGGYSGGPVLSSPKGPTGEPKLVAVMSRGVTGLSTEATLGPPGIATDLTHHGEWLGRCLAGVSA